MLNTAMNPSSVVDRVINGIISSIVIGELQPGDRLPTEQELSKKYDAGRNSVREAIKQLQAYGVVYIRRADGTYISDSYDQKMLDPMLYSIILKKNDWKDFVALREVIDIGILNVVIQREDVASFLPDLYRTYGELAAEMYTPEPDVEKVLELDRQFHIKIARVTQNPMIETITNYITLLTLPSRLETTKRVLEMGDVDHFVDLHKQMLTVIERRQSDAIARTVQDHYVYWK